MVDGFSLEVVIKFTAYLVHGFDSFFGQFPVRQFEATSLFKSDVWNENYPADSFPNFVDASLQNFTSGGNKKKARYRWNWGSRSNDHGPHDYTALFTLVDALNSSIDYTLNVDSVVNVEQWMKELAFQRLVGNEDSYGWFTGHNTYAYKPTNPQDNKWQLLPWDLDHMFGVNGNASDDDLFSLVDYYEPVIYQMLSNPQFQRSYWRGLKAGIDGPLSNLESAQSQFDVRSTALSQNFIVTGFDTSSVKSWASDRKEFIADQYDAVNAGVVFEITSNNGQNFTTTQSSFNLIGTAPIPVTAIKINSIVQTPTWNFLDPNANPKEPVKWTIEVSLNVGANILNIQGYDGNGSLVGTDSITITRQ